MKNQKRTCRNCGRKLPETEFYANRNSPSRLCKDCHRAYRVERYPETRARERILGRANGANRRAKRMGIAGRLTYADIEAALEKSGGRCFYCSADICACATFEIDHLVPLCRGGANEPNNIVICCPPCNRAKNRKTHIEFMAAKVA